jgi:hypothetical protein
LKAYCALWRRELLGKKIAKENFEQSGTRSHATLRDKEIVLRDYLNLYNQLGFEMLVDVCLVWVEELTHLS